MFSPEEAYDRKFNADHYSRVPWRRWEDPDYHWSVPVVSGRKYRLSWGSSPEAILDFTCMRFEVTGYLWTDPEGDFELELPFRDYREAYEVTD